MCPGGALALKFSSFRVNVLGPSDFRVPGPPRGRLGMSDSDDARSRYVAAEDPNLKFYTEF